jgi:single-strand DNA-binding protein
MNSVNAIGHLTKDPEMIQTSGGTQITNLRVAINGRSDNDTTYVDVKVIGKSAAACDEYLAKGSKVGVEGRLAFDEWENDKGEKRSRLYILGRIDFLDGKDRDVPEAKAEEPAAL